MSTKTDNKEMDGEESDLESSSEEETISNKTFATVKEMKEALTEKQIKEWAKAGQIDLVIEAREMYYTFLEIHGINAVHDEVREKYRRAFKKALKKAFKTLVKTGREEGREELTEPLSVLIDQPFAASVARDAGETCSSRVPTVPHADLNKNINRILQPVQVTHWSDFEAVAKLASMPSGEDVRMPKGGWEPLEVLDCGENEPTLLRQMDVSVLEYLRKALKANSKFPAVKIKMKEGAWVGGRVDVSWTRKTEDVDRVGLRVLATHHMADADNCESVFLVHEHKAAKVFPFVPYEGFEYRDGDPDAGVPRQLGDRRSRRRSRRRSSQNSTTTTQSEMPAEDRDEGLTQELDLLSLWARYEACSRTPVFFKYVAPIAQTFSYMICSGLKYAILSTTDKTWFCQRDMRGGMQISSPYDAHSGTGMAAVRRAYLGMLVLALEDEHATGYGLIKGRKTLHAAMKASDSEGMNSFADFLASNGNGNVSLENASKYRKRFEEFCAKYLDGGRPGRQRQQQLSQEALEELQSLLPLSGDDLRFSLRDCESLHKNERTIVDRCHLYGPGGIPFILKRWTFSIAPTSPEENSPSMLAFDQERWAYERVLRCLQGISIPFLIYAGPYATMPFVLAVSDEGVSLESLLRAAENEDERSALLEANFDSAYNALRSIHACGVLHNDIAARNILVHPEKGVKIIDFESASLYSEDLAEEDLRAFYRLFKRTRTGTPRNTGEKAEGLSSNQCESKPPADEVQVSDSKKRRVTSLLRSGWSAFRALDSTEK